MRIIKLTTSPDTLISGQHIERDTRAEIIGPVCIRSNELALFKFEWVIQPVEWSHW
jgi:hypothetical protein